MSEPVQLSLTAEQRDLIVEGLRYVRSSRRYEFRDPLGAPDPHRESDLREIAGLMTRLDPQTTAARASDA